MTKELKSYPVEVGMPLALILGGPVPCVFQRLEVDGAPEPESGACLVRETLAVAGFLETSGAASSTTWLSGLAETGFTGYAKEIGGGSCTSEIMQSSSLLSVSSARDLDEEGVEGLPEPESRMASIS
jgi:hypothetical protein